MADTERLKALADLSNRGMCERNFESLIIDIKIEHSKEKYKQIKKGEELIKKAVHSRSSFLKLQMFGD